ncbi:hypothetical protein L484_022957 [Morus notabilis]|uniref:RNase H type-1 domain-containing protein n=1 Tax=Morus notabilis TaxID=981085 RepID=W9QTT9_9ROSA|nr:hypothetical protein L484_022957 [Morus notabilis]
MATALIASPLDAEAMAALLAIKTAILKAFNFSIFEGDSELVVKAISSIGKECGCEISNIISDALSLLPL